jgi:hypothetical protein
MKTLSLILVALFVSSCATQKNKEIEVNDQVARTHVSDTQTLGGTIHDLIANSKTLTEAQKKELVTILDANKKRAEQLTEKSFKFRGVMIEELLSGNMDTNKVKILKKNIKEVENEKLKNTFDAVEKISAIVSKHPENEQFTQHLINLDRRPIR